MFRTLLPVLLLLFFVQGAAFAQNGGANGNLLAQQTATVESLTKRADDIERTLNGNPQDDARLVEIRLQLEEMARQVLSSGVAFRPRLSEINARLEQIGPPPAEGQPPEPELVAQERQRLTTEKAEINALLGAAENLSLRVNGMVERIAEMRRDLFANLLTKRYEINVGLAGEVATAASSETAKLYRSVSSWLNFVVQFKLRSVLLACFFALVCAAVLFVGAERVRRIVQTEESADPSYLNRLSVAFWSTLTPSLILGAFLGLTYFFFDYLAVLRPDIATMIGALFQIIGMVYFVHSLSKAALSPARPQWRLLPVSSPAAARLVWLATATALLTGLNYLFSVIFRVLTSPLALTVGASLLSTVLVGLLVILIGRVRPFQDEHGTVRPWPALLRYFLFVLGGVTIVAALLGYIGFARFLAVQIVVTGAILATMYIGFLAARAMAEEGAFAHTRIGRRLQRRPSVDETTLDQLGLAMSILVSGLILLLGLPLILFQWGFQPGDISTWLYTAATGIRIGNFTLSLVGIFWGVLVFFLGFFATRWFQRWLDGSVMERGRVDAGVRNSIRTVVGYAGVALAGLIAISAAGLDLSNFALIAGGLSLGVGFGLQNIVQNFVSGLILLAERPFKTGDWIVAATVSGTVKKISVRATEVETFQRQTVIVPNSLLVNAQVGNWTHRNRLGRVDIPVNVSYGADPRKVYEALLAIGRGHPLVLKNPEPSVVFLNIAENALVFELRVFVADITSTIGLQNDLRFSIIETFAKERIGIAYLDRLSTVKDPLPEEPEAPAEAAPGAISEEQSNEGAAKVEKLPKAKG